ncbi:unnamed protein product [Parnassius apollo]|uniref:(apollo) hypothetical protein n=1 Tax=Parnassius apollo TaxID=110799 RepID=A0A8S3X250_PARAO|nr:unnamed protein product [Parnassius apollo]
MSVVRSPPQSSNMYNEGNRDSIATISSVNKLEKISASQPDLRKITLSDNTNQITLRAKRKQPHDDFSIQFDKFQAKIESLIEDIKPKLKIFTELVKMSQQ